MSSFNTKSPAVKRLMREAQELSQPTELYFAQPLEDNLFEWHFTIRGPDDSDFTGGIYHGRINLPSDYPMKPPNITLLTPNGRFEQYRQICLSISGYHPETWLPSWSIRTALLAIIGFMPTSGVGAIGSMDLPPEQRRKLALSSEHYVCDICGPTKDLVLPLTSASSKAVEEAKVLAAKCSITDPSVPKSEPDSEVKSAEVAASETPKSTAAASAQTWTPPTANGVSRLNTFSGLPQPAYWLCYPVYGNVNANSNATVTQTSSNFTTTDGGPLGFEEWLKKVRETEPASTSSDQPSTGTVDIKIDFAVKNVAPKVVPAEDEPPKTSSPDITSMSAVSEAMVITKEFEKPLTTFPIPPVPEHASSSASITVVATSHPATLTESTDTVEDQIPKLQTAKSSPVLPPKVISVPISGEPTSEVKHRMVTSRPLARSSREAAERILKEAAAKHRQRLQLVTGQLASGTSVGTASASPGGLSTPTLLAANRHSQQQQRTVRMAQLAALGLSFLLLTLICRRIVLMVF